MNPSRSRSFLLVLHALLVLNPVKSRDCSRATVAQLGRNTVLLARLMSLSPPSSAIHHQPGSNIVGLICCHSTHIQQYPVQPDNLTPPSSSGVQGHLITFHIFFKYKLQFKIKYSYIVPSSILISVLPP